MTNYIKQNKVVNVLPATLDKDAIYYVRVREGFDIYVTNLSGVAFPLNSKLSEEKYSAIINEEAFGIPKGTPVYATGSGCRIAQANSPNCKKLIGLAAFDTAANQLGLVQKNGMMVFNNTEWSVISGSIGGVSNVNYWLDAINPGKISSDWPVEKPTPVWSLKLGCGVNSTTFSIQIQPSVKL